MEDELRASTDHAFHFDITPMCLHDAARDGEAQAGSARTAIAGFLAAIEPFEDVCDVFRADTLAGVTHGYFHA